MKEVVKWGITRLDMMFKKSSTTYHFPIKCLTLRQNIKKFQGNQ